MWPALWALLAPLVVAVGVVGAGNFVSVVYRLVEGEAPTRAGKGSFGQPPELEVGCTTVVVVAAVAAAAAVDAAAARRIAPAERTAAATVYMLVSADCRLVAVDCRPAQAYKGWLEREDSSKKEIRRGSAVRSRGTARVGMKASARTAVAVGRIGFDTAQELADRTADRTAEGIAEGTAAAEFAPTEDTVGSAAWRASAAAQSLVAESQEAVRTATHPLRLASPASCRTCPSTSPW